ncbi:MAG: MlaD family protein [bacterium]
MKKDITNKIRLGIFVTLGIAAFIVAIYYIGEGQQLFRSSFRVSSVFKDVAGLQAGNNVRLSGVNVGTVDNIIIVSDTSVRVDIIIEESTRKFIKKDAVASIGTEGFMGNKILIINPGTGSKKGIEENDVIETIPPFNMDEVMLALKTNIDNSTKVTNDLSMITNSIQSGKGTIGMLLMDESLAKNIKTSIQTLQDGTTGLKNLMEDANNSFAQFNFDEFLISIETTMKNASDITNDLSGITNNINSGNGMIGKLLMDKSMAQNIDSTLINLKEVSAEFKILIEEAEDSWLLWGF